MSADREPALGAVRGRALTAAATATRTVVKNAAWALDNARLKAGRVPRGIVLLAYHRVGAGAQVQMRLDTDTFVRQMDWLAEHARVISLDTAADELAGRSDPGDDQRPSVVLTFDDGTADYADTVVPALIERSLPSTVYVATDFVDRNLPWDDGAPSMSWSALADCAMSELVTVASHTHAHLLLDRVSPAIAAADLDTANHLFERHLGRTPAHFAYPKAVPASAPVAELIAQRYVTAAVAGTTANPWVGTDLQNLSRSPIQASDSQRMFTAKVHGLMAAEDRIRSTINRIRYRGRTT